MAVGRSREGGGDMGPVKYVKVFAGAGIYLGLIPSNLLDLGLKQASANASGVDPGERLYSEHLAGVRVTALYLMQDVDGGCVANCGFCVQARDSVRKRKTSYLVDKELLRVPLPTLRHYLATNEKAKRLERLCIQTVYNPRTVEDLLDIVRAIREASDVPVTACSIPIGRTSILQLRDAGLTSITINYEAATPALFEAVRGRGVGGPYRWEMISDAIRDACEVFGAHNVGTHLQLGLGETQEEALRFIQHLRDQKVGVSLFSFKPLPGTRLSRRTRISYEQFHQIQLGSYLIQNDIGGVARMVFGPEGELRDYGIDRHELEAIVGTGRPFRNRGCSGCNRVYYETNTGERHYSYPRDLSPEEIEEMKRLVLPASRGSEGADCELMANREPV